MLGFLRRIRRTLLEEGHLRKYLVYAVGEILLVVLGILIALQINNLNEGRKDRITENKLLLELKENLEINRTRLQNEIQGEHNSISAINLVVEHLDHRRPYHDSLDAHFFQAFWTEDVVLSSSAFESIKSKGFEVINSDDMRKDIIELFEVTYANLINGTVRLEDQVWPASVLPIVDTHFRLSAKRAKPVDYEALLNDKKYTNMIVHRKLLRELAIELYGISGSNRRGDSPYY